MKSWIGVALLAAGGAAVLAGQILFHLHAPYPPPPRFSSDPTLYVSLALFCGGLVAFLIGLCLVRLPSLGRAEAPPDAGRTSWWHKGAVVLVLLLAFGVRAYRLTEMPPPLYDDEANTALDAMKYLDGQFSNLIGTGWGEVPMVYTAMNSLSHRFFGPTVLGARMTGLVFSTLTVLVLYFLARKMLGPNLALLAMLGLALQRWHLTMSRWGASEIALPLFVTLAFLFTVVGFDLVLGAVATERFALRRPRRPPAEGETGELEAPSEHVPWHRWRIWPIALGGALLGFSMYIYLASRLVAVGVCAFLAYFVAHGVGLCVARRRLLAGMVAHRIGAAVLFGVLYLAVFAPLGRYYRENPHIFTNRWKDISLPSRMGLGTGSVNWQPLVDNLTSYALMLNYTSNEVGRHGIPFRPLLNVVSGTLFALGLVCLLRRCWRPADAFVLMWLFVPLLGGAITVSETPSPYRTIAAAPAVALITVVPLYYAFLALAGRRGGCERALVRRVCFGAAAGLLLASGIWDLALYWGEHRAFHRLHRDYNYPEYLVARRVTEIDRTSPVYLFVHYSTFSSVKLLNWGQTNWSGFVPSEHIPVLNPRDTDAHLILPLREREHLDALRLFHPGAAVVEHPIPEVPADAFYEIVIPAADFAGARGYWRTMAAAPAERTRELVAPAAGDVTWETTLDVPRSGFYRFTVRATQALGERCRLVVSGQPVAGPQTTVSLIAGRAAMRLVLLEAAAGERVDLLWQVQGEPPAPVPLERAYAFPSTGAHGLLGTYYRGTSVSGEVLMQRVDLVPSANETVPSPHSVRWSGYLEAPADGAYTLSTKSDDGSRLFLEGRQLIDNWGVHGAELNSARVQLARGKHPLELHYFDQGGGRAFQFTWDSPAGQHGTVPFTALMHDPPAVDPTPYREP